MNKIKYFLVAILTAFFYYSNVEALQNVGSFNNLTIAEKGMIYNNSSDTATSQVGYNLEDITFRDETVKSIFNTSNLQTVANGYGASISQCGLSFVANGYYSISFYFLGDALAQQSYSPSFSKKTYKLGLSNGLNGSTSFNYDTFEYGENVYPNTNGLRVEFYTVIFKAPSNGTCVTSVFSTSPTYNHIPSTNPLMYIGYNFEYLGDKPLSAEDMQNALSGQFNSVNNKIDDVQNSINSNIDDLKEKQDEQNETSKGIWGTLTSGLSNIGNWFSDLASSIGNFFSELGEGISNGFSNLFDGIKSFFVGEEVCEDTKENYFKGYNSFYNYATRQSGTINLSPDVDGWITYESSSNDLDLYASSISKDFIGHDFNIFVEVGDYSFTPTSSTGNSFTFEPLKNGVVSSVNKYSSPLGVQTSWTNKGTTSLTPSPSGSTKCKDNICMQTVKYREAYYDYYITAIKNNSSKNYSIKFRILITDDLSMTLDNYEYFNIKKECSTSGGLFGMITNFMNSVGSWFGNLLTGILDGLKALFIPDSEYFSNYFSSLYDFFTEKLGILMYPLDLIIDILNRFMNLSSDITGLIHIPTIAIPGFGTLIEEQSFYLNENWNTEPIFTLYTIYKSFVICFIAVLLINLARKKEKEIVDGSGN